MSRRRSVLIITAFGLLSCVGTIILVYQIIDESSSSSYRFEFPSEKNRNLPDCIIFGAKKGGTRALLEFVNLHPDVEISPREVHHFNFDGQYKRGLNWYRSQMPLVSKGQLTIEKSPNYFISRATPQRIYKMNKDIKLILAVREPVERSISDYVQSYSGKNRSFEDQAFLNKNLSAVNTRWWPIRISNYASKMKKWLEVFPSKQILVVECSALTSDPALQMQRVEKFLGLQPYITSDNFYFNPLKGFMCWRHNASDHGRCLGDGKGRKHPPVDDSAVASLRKYFAKSNRLFYKQVGFDFDWPVR